MFCTFHIFWKYVEPVFSRAPTKSLVPVAVSRFILEHCCLTLLNKKVKGHLGREEVDLVIDLELQRTNQEPSEMNKSERAQHSLAVPSTQRLLNCFMKDEQYRQNVMM